MARAWFITHDGHEDSRNICLLQSLADLGYEVLDFSDMKAWGAEIPGVRRVPREALEPGQVIWGPIGDFPRRDVAGLVATLINHMNENPDMAGRPVVTGSLAEGMRFARFLCPVGDGCRPLGFLCLTLGERGPWASYDFLSETLFVAPHPIFTFASSGLMAARDIIPLDQYFVLDRDAGRPLRHAYPKPITLRGVGDVDFEEFTAFVNNTSVLMGRVASRLERREELPDVVVVTDVLALPVGLTIKAATGCRLVVDCHEWYMWDIRSHSASPTKDIQERIVDRYEGLMYAACDARATVGRHLGGEMEKRYGCSFDTLYACVMPDEEAGLGLHDETFWQVNVGLPEDARVAVYIGGLLINRNLHSMIRASRHLADDQYMVILGDGPLRQELEDLLHREGNPRQVRFLGYLPGSQLGGYSANAHVGIIPYTGYNYYYSMVSPNKFSHYYAARVPILADHTMKEIVDVVGADGTGQCVDLSSPETFGTTLRDMLAGQGAESYRHAFSTAPDRFSYAAFRAGVARLVGQG